MASKDSEPKLTYHHASDLNENSCNWVLKCKLLKQGNIRPYSRKGFRYVMTLLFVDEEGMRIQLTLFNEAIDIFESVFCESKYYEISQAKIKKSNPTYNAGSTQYEIFLDRKSQVVELKDFNSKNDHLQYSFVSLKSINKKKNEKPVIGLSLSTTMNTMLQINLPLEEVEWLKTWAENNDENITENLHKYNSIEEKRIKGEKITIKEILQNAKKGISEFTVYQIKASPVQLNNRTDPWYEACAKCNKKVYSGGGDDIICQKCKNSTTSILYRYMMRLKLKDNSDEFWISLFDKEVEYLLNSKADELRKLKEIDITSFIKTMNSCLHKLYNFTITVTVKEFNNEKTYNYTCISIDEGISEEEDYVQDGEENNISMKKKRKVVICDSEEEKV